MDTSLPFLINNKLGQKFFVSYRFSFTSQLHVCTVSLTGYVEIICLSKLKFPALLQYSMQYIRTNALGR